MVESNYRATQGKRKRIELPTKKSDERSVKLQKTSILKKEDFKDAKSYAKNLEHTLHNIDDDNTNKSILSNEYQMIKESLDNKLMSSDQADLIKSSLGELSFKFNTARHKYNPRKNKT